MSELTETVFVIRALTAMGVVQGSIANGFVVRADLMEVYKMTLIERSVEVFGLLDSINQEIKELSGKYGALADHKVLALKNDLKSLNKEMEYLSYRIDN